MKLSNFFKQAQVVAENSHDTETQVGALLINESTGAVLSSGFNGFARGADDNSLPTTRPEKYLYILHAEMNMLLNSCRHGISTEGCYVVCTMSPCKSCIRSLWQAGIRTIYFQDKYRDFEDQLNMRDLRIELTKVQSWYKLELGV